MFVNSAGNSLVILLVYVDDIILTGNNEVEIAKVKDFLKSRFFIKDFGKLKYFLGIEVIDVLNGLCFFSAKILNGIVKRFWNVGV